MSSPQTTRKRSGTPTIKETADNLPPPRRSFPLRSVAPPLSKFRLSTLIYILVVLTSLLGAYYSYRLVQYKSAVGGWWSLALGKRPPQMQVPLQGAGVNQETQPNTNWNGWRASKPVKSNTGGEDSVEAHIQGLATALGMPTNELASAIASAVRAYVPPASLSSVAAKETGEAVKVLLQEPSESETKTAGENKDGSGKGVDSVLEAMVGLDEP